MAELETENLVIGAGVVGLAVAAELARKAATVLIEAHPRFGQETSSRNSEVIHSGIYYDRDSYKTRWCIDGRERLYAYCTEKDVRFSRTGKILVAGQLAEDQYLGRLAEHCQDLGVPHVWLTGPEIQSREPLVQVKSGLLFPETGIVDSHQLMAALERQFIESGGTVAYRHRVGGAERQNGRWRVEMETPAGKQAALATRVINAAGLGAAELANLALRSTRYEHRYCRGRYFTLPASYQGKFQHLVYPVPDKDCVGVHVTVDLEGFARLGPDTDWCPPTPYRDINRWYDCDWESLRGPFTESVRKFCPSISAPELKPGQIGIRPKLFIDGKEFPDFLVQDHQGWIDCLGVESPGLTSCLALARHVARL